MKAKKLSLVSKIFAGVWMVIAVILNTILLRRPLNPGETWGIIQQSLFLALIFSPVDISMIVRNFRRNILKGGMCEDNKNNEGSVER